MKRVAAVAGVLALTACSHSTRVEPGGTPPHEASRSDAGVAPTQPGATGPENPAVTPAVPPSKVKIFVRSTPPKAFVTWGKKKLGPTPLTIERPRDSGPVDLVIRASGYFPVHTRAYTVKNDTIGVKLVRLQDRMSVFGAKQEIPADTAPGDPALDPANALKPGGAPPPAPSPPPALSP